MATSLVELTKLSFESKVVFTRGNRLSNYTHEIKLVDHHPNDEEHQRLASSEEFNLLKAAWILTLRCFQAKEPICISCTDGRDRETDYTTVFDVHVNLSWDIQTLLEVVAAEGRLPKPIFSESKSSQYNFSEESSLKLTQLIIEEPTATRSSVVKENLELLVTKDGYHTQASISNPSSGSRDMNENVFWTFKHVLDQIMTQTKDTKLAEIEYCSDWHKSKVQRFTKTIPTANSKCLHELILEKCKENPTKLAVRSFDGDLTYAELESLSLRLASHLVYLGVKPETFVLSGFQKSTWAIVARLAILLAGGAYISIHASNPPVYLDSVIQRTGTKIILCDQVFADQFHNTVDQVIAITPEWLRSLPLLNKSGSCPSIRSTNACTVLFTSGSTGKPKAIVQEHRSYVSAIKDYAKNLNLNEEVRFLHFDDYAFDISNLEFLVPLLLGGTCCVPGPMKSVNDLSDNVRILDANMAFLTPTVAIKVDPQTMSNLKILCIGGEPLPKDLLKKWMGTGTKLVNQFGMGEAAICCAYNDNVYIPNSSPATIGRSSSGAIWIVDPVDPNKLMPFGAIGEIVIEGPHLARGYLDQGHQATDRTKPAGFLAQNPPWLKALHPERESARLYKSGDLAKWTVDGNVEYIGRKDTIIKLDGCRINVLEVEHVARKCLTSNDVIVVDLLGIIDGYTDPRLAAFLYLSEHPECSETAEVCLKDITQDSMALEKVCEIKEVLAAYLPIYMIPTLFLLVTRMPRTPSKKTDRRMIRLISQKYYAQEHASKSLLSRKPDGQPLLPP